MNSIPEAEEVSLEYSEEEDLIAEPGSLKDVERRFLLIYEHVVYDYEIPSNEEIDALIVAYQFYARNRRPDLILSHKCKTLILVITQGQEFVTNATKLMNCISLCKAIKKRIESLKSPRSS